jgi:indole-3-glycerol phosphate synthase
MAEQAMAQSDALARICADTLVEVARRKASMGTASLEARIAEKADQPRGFADALARSIMHGGYGLIAEIKKASPSGGLIRPEFDPPALARAYKAGGATCLSVLTDGPHFQGSEADLRAARAAVDLPVIRKDFMLDPWQIFESRAMGADCILLILAALSDAQAAELEQAALGFGMDVLAEVHDRYELDRALRLKTPLIGVNNRNLKTLTTDLSTTEQLATAIPADRALVAESGIRSHADILRLQAAGARRFLVGESLMRQPDVTAATRSLLGLT